MASSDPGPVGPGPLQQITPRELLASLAGPRPPRVLDVREPAEHEGGLLPGAVPVPRAALPARIGDLARPEDPVVLCCSVGARSLRAAAVLAGMGYRDVSSLAGGIERWRQEGLPLDRPSLLSSEQRERYGRHLLLPEVGEPGQARLLGARVLVVGAGGLGSPVAMYLAAAGVGTIGIADADVVELSNLQRQLLHTSDRIGVAKVESAARTIGALNPDVRVVPFPVRLDRGNALEILRGHDVIVDCGDNFPTRYLLNDAAVLLGRPLVHGSIFRFEGQVTTFVPGKGPCYRCLYPSPPPAELAPSCADAGVLGVLPGIVGTLQATEVIKLILGKGDPLVGRLLVIDALGTRFTTLGARRDPDCAVCAPGRTIELVDYERFCAGA